MGKPSTTGIQRIINAYGYSKKGLIAAFQNEAAFRQEVGLAIIMIPLGVYLGNTNVEKALLLFSFLMVLVVELLNSAIENVVDRIGPEHHILAGRAKDIGSAAVLVAFVQMLICWSCILFL